MRIVQVTAGTGGWLCGTCLRDNELVRGLRALGHDAHLVPLYLPVTVDGEHADPSEPVRLGGVSVWLRHESALYRALPGWADAVVDAGPMLGYAAKRSGMTQPSELGALTVEMLRGRGTALEASLARFARRVAEDHAPDVVLLSNALLLGLAAPLRKATGRPVVCSLQGEAPFVDALGEPHRTEAWAAARTSARDVDAWISVSRWHADVMSPHLGIAREAITVVHNGFDASGFGPGAAGGARTLGYFARQCPDKGLDRLVSAWAALRRRPSLQDVALAVGGAVTGADVPFVEEQRRRVETAGGRATWLANATKQQKTEWFRQVSVFSVPATYGESFGLYVLEALASGVPVVEPSHGGLRELVEETGGGVLVPPGDTDALADALESLLEDRDRARRLGEAGRRAVLERFTVEAMARGVAGVCEGVAR